MKATKTPPYHYTATRTPRGQSWFARDVFASGALVAVALMVAWGVTIVGATTSGELAAQQFSSTQLELTNDTAPTELDSATIASAPTLSSTSAPPQSTTSTSIVLGTVRTSTDVSIELSARLEERSVYVLGDSLVLSASDELRNLLSDNVTIDAETGLGLYYAADRIDLAAVGADIVVVSLGTNDFNEPEAFFDSIRASFAALDAANCVIWVDTQPFQSGLVTINEGIVAEATAAGRLVAGWSQLSGDEFPDRHVGDGYHLSFEGQEVFANLIASTIETGCL